MIWLKAHWPRVLALGNGVLFLVLVGIALWIAFRPMSSSPAPSGPAGQAGNPQATPTPEGPVFTVAPLYTTKPALTPTQALVTGHVVDATSKGPLAGAQLDFQQAGGPLRLHTDATGAYQAVVETAQPFGYTITAPRHAGGAVFGKLCPGDTRDVTVALVPAGGAPTSPTALQGSRC